MSWSVTDAEGRPTDAASVSSKGVLTGLDEGPVKVKAVSEADPAKSAELCVFVYCPLKSAALNTTSAVLSCTGGSLQITAAVAGRILSTPAGEAKEAPTGIVPESIPTVKYSIDPGSVLVKSYKDSFQGLLGGSDTQKDLIFVNSDTGLVSLNTDLLAELETASNRKISGSIKVLAEVSSFNGTAAGLKKTLKCTVSLARSNPLKKIQVSKTNVSISPGSSIILEALTNPVNPDTGSDIVWSAAEADQKYLTVKMANAGAYGMLTAADGAEAVGKTFRVTVSSAAMQREKDGSIKKDQNGEPVPVAKTVIKVTIVPSVTDISFSNGKTLAENGLVTGKSFTLKTSFTLSGTKGTANKKLIWTSSDESIATLNQNGAVKAIAPGEATITATSADTKADGSAASASVSFSTRALVTKLQIDKMKLTLGTSDSARYGKISIAALLPENATNQEILWTASTGGVLLASIDSGTGSDIWFLGGQTASAAENNAYSFAAGNTAAPTESSVSGAAAGADNVAGSGAYSFAAGNTAIASEPSEADFTTYGKALGYSAALIEKGLTGLTSAQASAQDKSKAAEDAAAQVAGITKQQLSAASVTTKAGEALAIKALTPGVVKLTGITTDGSKKTVSCTITVRGQVTGVWLNPKTEDSKGFNGIKAPETASGKYTGSMKPGTSLTLKPVTTIENVRSYENGKKYYNAFKSYTDTAVSYRSSDPAAAKVDKGGKISIPRTVLGENEASKTVSVFAMSPDGTQVAEYEITVKK